MDLNEKHNKHNIFTNITLTMSYFLYQIMPHKQQLTVCIILHYNNNVLFTNNVDIKERKKRNVITWSTFLIYVLLYLGVHNYAFRTLYLGVHQLGT